MPKPANKRSHVTVKCPNGHSDVFRRSEAERCASVSQLRDFDQGKRQHVDIKSQDCPTCQR